MADKPEGKKPVPEEKALADKKPEQGAEKQDRRPKPEEQKKGSVFFTQAVPARVEEVIGRTGMRGEAVQVRCKVLEGSDANKVLRRNVVGPVKVGDMLMLRETEIEARNLTQRRR